MMNHTCQACIAPILPGFLHVHAVWFLFLKTTYTFYAGMFHAGNVVLNVPVKTAVVFKLENVL